MTYRTGNLPGKSLALVLTGVWLTGNVWAADEDAYFSELPIVASVSRLPQRLADAPAAVTVVDRDMIKVSGARDLNDIFRLVPGFQTYPNNTEAARATYHGLGDGDYAPRVQVLIDGRSMLSPLFGNGVNWATLPVALEDIERIEVVRGTNAVSYGSNAFLGVINIITIDPALVRGFSVSSSYGSQSVRDYSLRAGGKIGEVGDFRFTYRDENDSGLANRFNWIDSYRSRLLDFRADFALSEKDSLQFSMGQAEGVTQAGRHRKSAHQGRVDRNDVDDAKKGIATIGNSIGPADDFDTFDIFQRYRQRRPIDTTTEQRRQHRPPIDQHLNAWCIIAIAQAVVGCPRRLSVVRIGLEPGHQAENIVEIARP